MTAFPTFAETAAEKIREAGVVPKTISKAFKTEPVAPSDDRLYRLIVCSLYNVMKGPSAILDFTRAVTNAAGNLNPGKVYPDYAGGPFKFTRSAAIIARLSSRA